VRLFRNGTNQAVRVPKVSAKVDTLLRFIAVQALELGTTLVSGHAEFVCVPGL